VGQLFNRISRFVKSEVDDYEVTSAKYADYYDDELKRIIDELEKEKTFKDKSSYKTKGNSTQKDENKVFTLDEAYSILGIKSSATNEEIKSAYKQKMKEYHPDRVADLGIELKQLAEQKTQQINNAYVMIKKLRGFN